VSSPLDATGTTVSLYGVLEDGSVEHWDDAGVTWSGAGLAWQAPAWHDASCDVLAFSGAWGVDDDVGCIGTPAAGAWGFELWDPDRELDPLNASSPYRRMLGIRTPVRLATSLGAAFATVYLDELTHAMLAETGHLDAIDAIGLLGTSTTSSTFDPFSVTSRAYWQLGALIRAILVDCSLDAAIGVGTSIPATGASSDPLIAPRETKGQNALELIRGALNDVLYYLWVDATGALQLAEYGFVVDQGLILGDGGVCLSDLVAARSASGVVNVVSDAWDELGRRGSSVKAYGVSSFGIDRIAPGGAAWASAILDDRASAIRHLVPLELLPVSEAELLDVRNKAPGRRVTIKAASVTPAINTAGQGVGGTFAAEGGGVWRASVRVYQAAKAFDYNPPSPASIGVIKRSASVAAGDDTFVWYQQDNTHGRLVPGATDLVAQGSPLTVAGQRRGRILLPLPIDWQASRGPYIGAWLWMNVLELNPAPAKLDIRRVIGDWSPDAVDWPGPTTDQANRLTPAPGGTGWQGFDVSAIVWYLLPQSQGGYGLPNLGVELRVVDETVAALFRIAGSSAGEGAGPYVITYWGE
jgi:hypothetical protein